MFKKAYLEIGNICNLNCCFCKKSSREKGFISPENFRVAAGALSRLTSYLYLHVSGEPLLHPQLDALLDICAELRLKCVIVSNGTLIKSRADMLLSKSAVYKLVFSLHSFEANAGTNPREYIADICSFAERAAQKGILISLRLWNGGGQDSLNPLIEKLLKDRFKGDYATNRRGFAIDKNIFLEYGQCFDWPDIASAEREVRFCMGLRDHIGVLCDGTVIPCCLDVDGKLALGNIFSDDLENILKSERAEKIYKGFSQGKACEELCRHCGKPEKF